MTSERTNFGVYRDVRTETYQDTKLKNAKEEDSKISKWTACKSEIMISKTVSSTLTFHRFCCYTSKATKCFIQSKSVMLSLAKQKQKQNSQVPMKSDRNLAPNLSNSFYFRFFHHIHLT